MDVGGWGNDHATAGCSGGPGAGQLGPGAFVYRCERRTDVFCDGSVDYREMPPLIAVGASFHMAYRSEPGADLIAAEAPAPSTARLDGTRVQLLVEGPIAVLARNEDQPDQLENYSHLVADRADRLVFAAYPQNELEKGTVEYDAGTALIRLSPGSTLRLMAPLSNESLQWLAGNLGDYTWASSDPLVVNVTPASEEPTAVLSAGLVGEAVVSASVGGVTSDIRVIVEVQP